MPKGIVGLPGQLRALKKRFQNKRPALAKVESKAALAGSDPVTSPKNGGVCP
jgi:hypothetical protein